MQILTLVVQNTVDYSDLGTATSGVTFFRTLGGSFGASIMGSIFSNGLKTRLATALVTAKVPAAAVASPDLLKKLPAQQRDPIVTAYAQSLQHVFLFAVPIALVALVLALFLPQVTMRGLARVSGPGDGFAVPEGSDNEQQLANVVGHILRRDNRSAAAQVLASSGTRLDLAMAWGVMGVFLQEQVFGVQARETTVETRLGVPPGVLRPFYDEIVTAGYLRRDGDALTLTDSGRAETAKITAAWRAWLMGELQGWLKAHEASPDQVALIEAAIDRIVIRLIRENEAEQAQRSSRPRPVAAAS